MYLHPTCRNCTASAAQARHAVPFLLVLRSGRKERIPIRWEQKLQLCEGHSSWRRSHIGAQRMQKQVVGIGLLPKGRKKPIQK
jgi:hypothetical protein